MSSISPHSQPTLPQELRDHRDTRRLFVGLVCVLMGVGVQMVHSASLSLLRSSSEHVFLSRHLIYLCVSVLAGWLASLTTPRFLKTHANLLLGVLAGLLVLVLIPGIGTRVNGAQRWLRAGGISLQPSELGRIIMPIVAVKLMLDQRSKPHGWLTIPRTLWPLAVVLPLVVREPDLGATVFLAIGFLTALFLGGWPLRYFLGCGVLVVPAVLSLFALKSYQLKRITGFMDAWQDLSQAPWQIRQSLLSLGSGGLQGTGVGGGWQKLSYLPEANTDFVFAVIGEELGLAGTLTIIIIWVGVYLTGMASLKNLPDRSFAAIVGRTLVIQIVLQALANVAVVTAMVPPKGVPHPFISYGGTNLLVTTVAIGFVVAMSRQADSDLHQPAPN